MRAAAMDAARADHASPPPADALRQIAAAWARVGGYLSTAPADSPIDMEGLIVATARVAPDDERLFAVAASWLAAHHSFVSSRRLAVLAAELADAEGSAEATAVLGALLSWADDLSGNSAEALRAAVALCRPVRPARPLFRVVRALPSVAAQVRRAALPRFAVWGLWHDGDIPKPEAVRPVEWIVAHTPELRIRALSSARRSQRLACTTEPATCKDRLHVDPCPRRPRTGRRGCRSGGDVCAYRLIDSFRLPRVSALWVSGRRLAGLFVNLLARDVRAFRRLSPGYHSRNSLECYDSGGRRNWNPS